MTAWIADFLAFVREVHHLMRMNDRKPTPSHPINSRKTFFVEVKIIIFSRNIIKNRKNFFGLGSLFI